MSRHAKLLLMSLFTLIFPLCTTASPAEGTGPKLEFDSTSYDFGTVAQGKLLEHSFKVFNRGNKPLKIKSVRPG